MTLTGHLSRPTVLFTTEWPDRCLERAENRYDVIVANRGLDRSGLAAALKHHVAICCTITDRLDADLLSNKDLGVRMLANFGAGTDHIDLAAAASAGVIVSNTPDVLTEATAETAILLMLMAARRAGRAERLLRSGGWMGWRPTGELGTSLSGKTLALVGFGRIAQATARMARGLGMTILYTARRRGDVQAEADVAALYVPRLADMAQRADILSLHCPGGAETHHLINADILTRMRPGAIVVNSARGSVIDEKALAKALSTGHIAAAGLDVYEREPSVEPALLANENAVLLPHIGSATAETREAMGMRALDSLDAFFSGLPIPDRVA